MKVYDKSGNHIKTVPKRYEEIPEFENYLDDFDHVRLSEEERELLDKILFGIRAEQFTLDMKKNYLYRDQIKDSYAESVKKVVTKHNHYHIIVYSNGLELKCSSELAKGIPVEKIKRLY